MKKQNLAVLFMLTFAFCFISCGKKISVDENGCYLSMDDAASNAEKKKQNILVIVTTGIDDEPSKLFIENILTTEDFKNRIASQYSTVNFDFSEASYQKTVVKEDFSKEEKKAAEDFANIMYNNARIASILNVQSAPAIYLFTKEKYFIAEVIPENDFNTVSDLEMTLQDYSETVTSMNILVNETKSGSVEKRITAIDTLYEATDSLHKTFLLDLIEQVVKLDKKNKSGLVSKYILAAANARASDFFLEGKIDEAVSAFTSAAKEKHIEPLHAQQLYYMAAYILAMAGATDYTQMINYLDQSIAAAPDSENISEIEMFKSYIQSASE